MLLFEGELIITLNKVQRRPSHALGAVQKQKQFLLSASANPVQNKKYWMYAGGQQGIQKEQDISATVCSRPLVIKVQDSLAEGFTFPLFNLPDVKVTHGIHSIPDPDLDL